MDVTDRADEASVRWSTHIDCRPMAASLGDPLAGSNWRCAREPNAARRPVTLVGTLSSRGSRANAQLPDEW